MAEQQEDLLKQPPSSAERPLAWLKALLRKDMDWHIYMSFFWKEPNMRKAFVLRWQPDSPWTPLPHHYTQQTEQPRSQRPLRSDL